MLTIDKGKLIFGYKSIENLSDLNNFKDNCVNSLNVGYNKGTLICLENRIGSTFSLGHLSVTKGNFEGNLYINAFLRPQEGKEVCIPRALVCAKTDQTLTMPVISLVSKDMISKKTKIYTRAYPFKENVRCNESIHRINQIGSIPNFE